MKKNLKICQAVLIPGTNLFPKVYVISKDTIELGDWCVLLDDFGNVMGQPQQWKGKGVINSGLRKIIATTDNNLLPDNKHLPFLAGVWAQVIFVDGDVLDKAIKVKDIFVWYVQKEKDQENINTSEIWQPFVDQNNNLSIELNPFSISIDSLLPLFKDCWNKGAHYGSNQPNSYYFEQWIEKNVINYGTKQTA